MEYQTASSDGSIVALGKMNSRNPLLAKQEAV